MIELLQKIFYWTVIIALSLGIAFCIFATILLLIGGAYTAAAAWFTPVWTTGFVVLAYKAGYTDRFQH
ncbi:hypothetical protein LCGC14_1205570 [marine sediment metagenome]|uniref:Uncharacterized protein n=1 Tax=marine sediment metagenome TaxID=412755 RepID=A0A0F9M2Z5_9ZZZZ